MANQGGLCLNRRVVRRLTINGGVIHAVGKGGAAGIGSKGDIRITGGELTVSAEGSGAAIGGFTDSYS